MCVPAAIALAAAAAAATMGGQFVEGQASYTNAKYKQGVADANAALANDQAKQEIDNTKLAAQRRYREAGQLEGAQTAAMAANGIDLNYGSAVDVARDSKMIANEDVGQIYKEGANKTEGYLIDAYNEKLKSRAAASSAKSAGWATAFGMASTALGAASQTGKMSSSFG